jgi:hypothetical protein
MGYYGPQKPWHLDVVLQITITSTIVEKQHIKFTHFMSLYTAHTGWRCARMTTVI